MCAIHDALRVFIELYQEMRDTMLDIYNDKTWNSENITKANGLYNSMINIQFIISLITCNNSQLIYLQRLNKRQLHRTNTSASLAEEYFKSVIYIPFSDHLMKEKKERSNKYILYISLGALLIPKVINENKDSWKENVGLPKKTY